MTFNMRARKMVRRRRLWRSSQLTLRYETEPVESLTCDFCGFGTVKAGYSGAYVHAGNDGTECMNCNPLSFPSWMRGNCETIVQATIERELA